jgi:hypothetical protein
MGVIKKYIRNKHLIDLLEDIWNVYTRWELDRLQNFDMTTAFRNLIGTNQDGNWIRWLKLMPINVTKQNGKNSDTSETKK